MNNENIEKLEIFLSGTFHQDISSPEEALEEYINEVDKEWITSIIDSAEIFLKSDISDEEKCKFIESNAEIFFPAMCLTPLQWFSSIIGRFKQEVSD